ncbi:MAG: MFS transporter [Sphingomonas sp.]|uniref:MFS transporter n=1 Tax=Sphingomonas sp. TaxID=28214 RepID=UPI002633FB65|nr:MFS transporter [Sphingomonas sp.]MDK2766099.1 MFS transporter [Sphingomonas sp.]
MAMASRRASDASSAESYTAPQTRLAFTILATIQATLIFTIALIMIPLPQIAAEFELSDAQILLLQIAYGLPFSGLLLFGGRLTDRIGGRAVLGAGLVAFGLASLAAALSDRYDLLLAMRFAQGFSGALIAPASLSVVRTLYSTEAQFGRAMATWGGVSVLGAVVGFISSGMVASVVDWRWMFAAPIAVSSLGFVANIQLFPKVAVSDRTLGLDPLGATLAALGIISLSYGLVASHEAPWTTSQVYMPVALGLALVGGFLAAERRIRTPLLPPDFLMSRARAIGWIGMLLAAAGSMLTEFALLVHLQQDRGWTPFDTALSFAPFAVALIATNTAAASIVSKLGAARAMAAGYVVGAVGLGLLAVLNTHTDYLLLILPAQVLLAIGMALIFSGSAVLATADVPLGRMGLAGGVMNTAMELGPTVGFTLLMAIAGTQAIQVDGFALAFGAAAIAYVAAAIGVTALAKGSGASR